MIGIHTYDKRLDAKLEGDSIILHWTSFHENPMSVLDGNASWWSVAYGDSLTILGSDLFRSLYQYKP